MWCNVHLKCLFLSVSTRVWDWWRLQVWHETVKSRLQRTEAAQCRRQQTQQAVARKEGTLDRSKFNIDVCALVRVYKPVYLYHRNMLRINTLLQESFTYATCDLISKGGQPLKRPIILWNPLGDPTGYAQNHQDMGAPHLHLLLFNFYCMLCIF